MHEPNRWQPGVDPARPEAKEASRDARGTAPSSEKNSADSQPAAPRTHKGRWIAAALLIVVAAIAIFIWYRIEHSAANGTHLELQGNIDVRQVNLAFKVEGRIARLMVDEGDLVKAGEVIATLDKKYFEDDLRLIRAQRENAKATLDRLEHGSRPEEIAEARAQVAEAKATLARAQQDYDRAERLVDKGAVSRENYDQAKATLDESQARLKYEEEALRLAELGPRQEDIEAGRAQFAAQEAAVIQSERRLADSDLIAPNDGIILTRAREEGAIVSPGETVFAITLISPVWVRTYVNERDLGRIRPDMRAIVRTDSAPDKPYEGHIGFISPMAEFTPKTVETRELRTDLVYRLRVVVDNPDGGLRQGMPVSVVIDLQAK